MRAVLILLSAIPNSGVKLRGVKLTAASLGLQRGGGIRNSYEEDNHTQARDVGGVGSNQNLGPLGWFAVQRCMRDVGAFLNLLRSYADIVNSGQANGDVIRAVDAYLALPNFNRDTLMRRSRAAGGICEWVRNIRRYYDVFCQVDPKRKALEKQEARLRKSVSSLATAKAHFRKVQEQLNLLTTAFTSATAKKNDALRRHEELQAKLNLAERLRRVLASEKARWESEITRAVQRAKGFVGDGCVGRIAFGIYGGGFDAAARESFLEQCTIDLAQGTLRFHVSRDVVADVLGYDAEGADSSGALAESTEEQDVASHEMALAAVCVPDRRVRADWKRHGALPSDRHSVCNGALLSVAARTPLLIDPHTQATTFLKTLHRNMAMSAAEDVGGIRVAGTLRLRTTSLAAGAGTGQQRNTTSASAGTAGDAAEENWRSVLRKCVQRGEACLIEGVGSSIKEPELVRLLTALASSSANNSGNASNVLPVRMHTENSSSMVASAEVAPVADLISATDSAPALIVSLGGVDVRLHPGFRLFLATQAARPHFSPDVQVLTTLLDFTVSPGALEEQLLATTVALECPSLERAKRGLAADITRLRSELHTLEDNLLYRLAHSQGDVLANETLVASLEHTKDAATKIADRVRQNRRREQETDKARSKYVPVAERGVLLFQHWSSLGQVDRLYQLPLSQFTRVFVMAIVDAERQKSNGALGARLGRTVVSGWERDQENSSDHHGTGNEEEEFGATDSSSSNGDAVEGRSAVSVLLESVTLACFRAGARVLYERHKCGYLFVLAVRLLGCYVPEAMPPDVVDFLLTLSGGAGGAAAAAASSGKITDPMVFDGNTSGGGVAMMDQAEARAQQQRSPLEWLPTPEWMSLLTLTRTVADFVIAAIPHPMSSMGAGGSLFSRGPPIGEGCSFKSLPQHIMSHPSRWQRWFVSARPETETLPGEWRNCSVVHHLLILACLRPDRLSQMVYSRLVDEPQLRLGLDDRYVKVLSAPLDVAQLLQDASALPARYAATTSTGAAEMSDEEEKNQTVTAAGDEENKENRSGDLEDLGKTSTTSSTASDTKMLTGGRAPMLFVVCPGTDPTSAVRDFALATGHTLRIAALGSGSQFAAAQALVAAAAGGGRRLVGKKCDWVLLQNVHLCRRVDMKRLAGLVVSATRSRRSGNGFCLFLTAEASLVNGNSRTPPPLTLLRACVTTTLEPPRRFDAHMRQALVAFEGAEWAACTETERDAGFQRCLHSLCYFHACCLARRDVGPVGWSRKYPFGTHDLRMGGEILRRIMTIVDDDGDEGGGSSGSGGTRGRALSIGASQSQNQRIDLVGLRHMIGEVVYGGHIIDPFDRRLCGAYMRRLFTEQVALNDGGCWLAPPRDLTASGGAQLPFPGLDCPQVDTHASSAATKQKNAASAGAAEYQPAEPAEKRNAASQAGKLLPHAESLSLVPLAQMCELHGTAVLLGMHPASELGAAKAEAAGVSRTLSMMLTINGGDNGGGECASGNIFQPGGIDTEILMGMIDSLLDELPHVGRQHAHSHHSSAGAAGGIMSGSGGGGGGGGKGGDGDARGRGGGGGGGSGSDSETGTTEDRRRNNKRGHHHVSSSGTYGFLFRRERATLVAAVSKVREELRLAEACCRGEIIGDRRTVEVCRGVYHGQCPRRWVMWTCPDSTTVPRVAARGDDGGRQPGCTLARWLSRVKRAHEFQARWGEAVLRQATGAPPLVDLAAVLNPRALLAAVRLVGSQRSRGDGSGSGSSRNGGNKTTMTGNAAGANGDGGGGGDDSGIGDGNSSGAGGGNDTGTSATAGGNDGGVASLDLVALCAELTSRQPQGITTSPQGGGLYVTGLQLEGAVWGGADGGVAAAGGMGGLVAGSSSPRSGGPVLRAVSTRQPRSALPVVHVYAEARSSAAAAAGDGHTGAPARRRWGGDGDEEDGDDGDGGGGGGGAGKGRGGRQATFYCPVYASRSRGESHLFDIPFAVRHQDYLSERWVVEGVAVVLDD